MKPNIKDVLKEVNKLRSDRDMKPIYDLKPGTHSGYSCPIAKALNTRYCSAGMLIYEYESIETPPTIKSFIIAFDQGEYPELESELEV